MTTTIKLTPLPERIQSETNMLRIELRDGKLDAALTTVRILQAKLAELAAELEVER